MNISEVRIKLTENQSDRLLAFCSITIDNCFVVRDLKIIEGTHGAFVAMPSRKLTAQCNECRAKNHLKAVYCNHCGKRIDSADCADEKPKLYADIAHPINAECREMVQNRVLEQFRAETELAKQPGYKSKYEDLDSYDDFGVGIF